MQYRTLSLAIALGLPSLAFAQGEEPATDLDQVLVTATRTEIALEDSLVPAQVIDREQIQRSQAQSLAQLLGGQAGIGYSNQGGLGKLTTFNIRGTESDHVLVLVDGVRVGSASAGLAAFQDLPLEQIERIEIVRGPHSSLYGSEAIGGVIHIFTRRAGQGLQTQLRLGAGSHDLREASAGFGYRGTRGWLSAHGARQETDGINACNGDPLTFAGCAADEPDRDGYRNTSISLRGGLSLTDTLALETRLLNADSHNEFDGSLFGGNESENLQRVIAATARWTPTSAFNLTVQAGRTADQADDYYAQGGSRTWVGTFDTRRDTASVQADIGVAEGQLLSVGGDWQNDRLTSSTPFDVDERDNTGVFAEYQGRFGAHSLQASVRSDDNEQFGEHTTGSLGYGLAFGAGMRFTASAGTGFKAPTFNDLYYPFFGNPGLKPEKSESLNLGLAQYGQGWNWTFNVYETRVDELISYDASIFLPNNVDKARIRGAELTGALSWAGFDVQAQLSHADARNDSGGANEDNWLARRARDTARIDVDRAWGKLRLGVTGNGAGHRYDDAANSIRLGGYATWDLRMEYALGDAWSLQARASNVFDRDYTTVDWYNQPGREYVVSVRWNGTH